MSFKTVNDFENMIADFFGAPHAVAVDCCTHAIELCLRYNGVKKYTVPPNTYPSIPNLADKIGIEFEWKEEDWENYYYLTDNIVDAAVLWKENSYIPNTFMCVSFQFRKHLSLGKGGIILTDDKTAYDALKLMSCDGRSPDGPWREQDISSIGYHYYMTPETAQAGLEKLPTAIKKKPFQWRISDWPNLTKMKVFCDQ